jgi:P63C domain
MLATSFVQAGGRTVSSSKDEKKVAAGKARAKSLSPAKRKAIAQRAAASRWAGDVPRATHDGEIELGDLQVECAVLEDGRRVISERAMTRAFGGKRGGSHWKRAREGGANLPVYLSAKNFSPFISDDLALALNSPIKYKTASGAIANGLDAALLPEVCDVFLKARDEDALHVRQIPLSVQADIIMRGLATVGIIALIDEATGYQHDRAVDALARILEKFIAKELQPWVRTFPDEFYQELYRLRDLDFPSDTVKKPSYFGHITNDIIYKRLAPGVLSELKKATPKGATGRHKQQLHRRLTGDVGHPKLMAHLDSVITVMKLTDDGDYEGFIQKLERVKPRYGKALALPFKERL